MATAIENTKNRVFDKSFSEKDATKYEFSLHVTDEENDKSYAVLSGKALSKLNENELAAVLYNEDISTEDVEDRLKAKGIPAEVCLLSEYEEDEELSNWLRNNGICYTDWYDCILIIFDRPLLSRVNNDLVVPEEELVAVVGADKMAVMLPEPSEFNATGMFYEFA